MQFHIEKRCHLAPYILLRKWLSLLSQDITAQWTEAIRSVRDIPSEEEFISPVNEFESGQILGGLSTGSVFSEKMNECLKRVVYGVSEVPPLSPNMYDICLSLDVSNCRVPSSVWEESHIWCVEYIGYPWKMQEILANAPDGPHLVGRKEYKLIYLMNQCMNKMVISFMISVNVQFFARSGEGMVPRYLKVTCRDSTYGFILGCAHELALQKKQCAQRAPPQDTACPNISWESDSDHRDPM